MPVLLHLLPVHACAAYDLCWRHGFENSELAVDAGCDGQQLRQVLVNCKQRAPLESAANALQAQLARSLEQVRDILGSATGAAHVAWAAAHVGHDAAGEHWQQHAVLLCDTCCDGTCRYYR